MLCFRGYTTGVGRNSDSVYWTPPPINTLVRKTKILIQRENGSDGPKCAGTARMDISSPFLESPAASVKRRPRGFFRFIFRFCPLSFLIQTNPVNHNV